MYERAKKFIRNQRIENNKLIKQATTGITPKTSKMVFDMSNTDDVHAVDTNKRAYIKAIELVSSLLNSFGLPSKPVLEYHGMVKNASDDNGMITDGVVKIGAIIRTLMGHNVHVNIPVIIKKKSLVEPAVFFHDDAPYVLCGTALDELIKRGSLEKSVLQRRMFSPPIENPTRQDDLPKENIIYQQNMFSPGFRNPMMFRRQYNKTAQLHRNENGELEWDNKGRTSIDIGDNLPLIDIDWEYDKVDDTHKIIDARWYDTHKQIDTKQISFQKVYDVFLQTLRKIRLDQEGVNILKSEEDGSDMAERDSDIKGSSDKEEAISLSPNQAQSCGFCGYSISKSETVCPNCGSPKKAGKLAQEYIDPDLAVSDPDLSVWDDEKIKERMEDPDEQDTDLRELVPQQEQEGVSRSKSFNDNISELESTIRHNIEYLENNKNTMSKGEINSLRSEIKELADMKRNLLSENKLMFEAQHKGEPRERTNIDVPVKMVEIYKDDLKDEMLDPAERCYDDYISIGTNVKLKEDYEARERGGSTIIIPKGQSGKVIKTEGDGKMLYVTFDNMGLSTYVPMRMFKSSKKKVAQSNDGPDYIFNTFIMFTSNKTFTMCAGSADNMNIEAEYDTNKMKWKAMSVSSESYDLANKLNSDGWIPIMTVDSVPVPQISWYKSIRTTAATVDQVKNEVKNMIREGYQKIDIIDSISRKYPEHADEALNNM